MEIKNILIAALVVLSVDATSILGCPNGQVLSPEGCLADCRSPEFEKCKDLMFIQIYDPKFCAWTTDNQWKSYTFPCQACQNPDVIGFKSGQCTGEQSTQQFPQPIPLPPTIGYSPFTRLLQRPPNPRPCNYRPDLKECPVLNYIQAPELNFCGLTFDGSMNGYDRACAACQDKNVVSYWETPCQELQTNQQRKLIRSFRRPLKQQCQLSEDCQFNWQICLEGACQDRCAQIRCLTGYQCVRGKCLSLSKKNYL